MTWPTWQEKEIWTACKKLRVGDKKILRWKKFAKKWWVGQKSHFQYHFRDGWVPSFEVNFANFSILIFSMSMTPCDFHFSISPANCLTISQFDVRCAHAGNESLRYKRKLVSASTIYKILTIKAENVFNRISCWIRGKYKFDISW